MKIALLPKLVIGNFVGFVGVAYLYFLGHLVPAFTADESHLSLVIAATFLIGLVMNFWYAFRLTYPEKFRKVGGDTLEMIKIKFTLVHDIGNYLVTLGLIGTAIGLLIAVQGIDFAALGSSDGLDSFGSLGAGMTTLTYNTILGGITWIWHSLNTNAVNSRIEMMRL